LLQDSSIKYKLSRLEKITLNSQGLLISKNFNKNYQSIFNLILNAPMIIKFVTHGLDILLLLLISQIKLTY